MRFLLITAIHILYLIAALTISSNVSSTDSSSTMDINVIEKRYSLPGLNHDSYSVLGDINIGAFMSITAYPKGFICSKSVRADIWILQYMEAVAFSVDFINKDPTILPNVTLGFVIVDYCRTPNIALAKSLSFLPLQIMNNNSTACTISMLEEISQIPTSSSTPVTPLFEAIPQYDVVGVLGPQGSSSTIAMSSLFSVARIPIVSYMATSDELSSTFLHPYFLRLVPPDRHQTLAMLAFIAENGWSYISVVYGDTSYGEKAYYNIKQQSTKFGICVATSHSVNLRTNFDNVLQNLLLFDRARVVIIFTDTDPALMLFAACERADVRNHFIWIGSDSISDKTIVRGQHLEYLHGAFTFTFFSKKVQEFEIYFRKLRPGLTSNPWFNFYWEIQTGCSFTTGTCSSENGARKFEELNITSSVSLVMDSVLTFAQALHALLNDICSNLVGKHARRCVKGELLIKRMLNTSFEGFTGKISFDENGDVIGKYEIRQIVWENEDAAYTNVSYRENLLEVPIAYFEPVFGKVVYTDRRISWSHLNIYPRIVPSHNGTHNDEHPESVCSRPCVLGEFKIQKELPCCWECRKCRDNERLINKNTACDVCDKFTWPDPATNFTTCIEIPPSYVSVYDTLSIIEVCLAATAIAAQCIIVFCYVYFREHPVIKASSRELSILQMVAIFVGYVTVILLQTMPTHSVCAVIYFTFCLSFAWLYSPLIVKAIRIYRIFRNSPKGNRRPRFVSPQSQLVMAGMFISIQVCLCVATYIIYRPSAKITQPIHLEKFVELSCDMTVPGLVSFLTYNLCLVSLCAALAFQTRKLPDNFNESRFMSMCVSTTLVIWLAFVPTYFTANREYVRVLLLSAALLINHTVALVFLFFPKVYAAVFAATENLTINRFQTSATTLTPNRPVVPNRVSPATFNPG